MKPSNTSTSLNLNRWHCGEKNGLEALLRRNLPWIQARVRRRLGSKLRKMHETDDIVQESALQFLLYGPRFHVSDENHFRALLARIVENVLRDKHDWFAASRRVIARERPLPPTTIIDLDPGSNSARTPSRSAERHEEEAWIRLGVELLDPEDREVIVLRQWESLSFVEIGKRLGLSPEAAWNRHNRAVCRLAKKIGDLRRKNLALFLADDHP